MVGDLRCRRVLLSYFGVGGCFFLFFDEIQEVVTQKTPHPDDQYEVDVRLTRKCDGRNSYNAQIDTEAVEEEEYFSFVQSHIQKLVMDMILVGRGYGSTGA